MKNQNQNQNHNIKVARALVVRLLKESRALEHKPNLTEQEAKNLLRMKDFKRMIGIETLRN